MPNRASSRSPRGFTLLELLVASGISAIVVLLAAQTLIRVDRDQFLRKTVTDVQSTTRLALGWMERDLRQSSLSVGSGVVWTASGANPVARPAVQIYANVPGGAFLDVMPNTDALLVVGAVGGQERPRATTVGTLTDSNQPISISVASTLNAGDVVGGFAQGQPVLLGDYGDGSWGVIGSVSAGSTPPTLSLVGTSANVFPAQQMKQLGAGASVRLAQSRLYYVNTQYQLIRLTLATPTVPTAQSGYGREVLAQGIENLRVDCNLDDGLGGFAACPAPLTGDPSPSDPLFTEGQAAFGNFGSSQGPRLTANLGSPARVMLLRNVVVNVSARSVRSVDSSQGDPVTAGVSLPSSAATPTASYVRRAYQLSAAVRNTSLGAF
ncbi:MAG TPA: prepilin-type N-terminal cleavage/methylation domain-containing protein [Anaeromyxobacteraceae bacterium]|jgi:prepilin-type N-terminal cleavage/methylation domain-containing protein|nr:prepilin-type N-terminal cleavage/methylation domain-containing protein [Anaeromyxobacteraceae bacterium]